jgi:putative ABC transport system ATP-binding protein
MISVRGVTREYGSGDARHVALNDVSVDVGRGEFISIMGSSGSGKTTLLNVMGGLDTDWKGTVEIAGQSIRAMGDPALSRLRNRSIGFIFQHFHLLEHMTCLENVTLPSYFGGAAGVDVVARATGVLERVGLGGKLHASPSALSGGQKQRVAIARALFNQPEIMLCDEPTGSLDRNTGLNILELFRELNETEQLTVVVVTHEEYVSRMARRIVRIEDGVIASDTPNTPTPPEEAQ